MPGAMAIRTLKKIDRGEPLGQGESYWADAFGLAFISADPALRERAGLKSTKPVQSPADPAINRQASSAPAAKQAARPAPGRASQRDYRIKRGPSGGGRASVLASELEPGRKTLLGG